MNQVLCRIALGVSLALGVGSLPAYAQPKALTITVDTENVIASRLEGTWALQIQLTATLQNQTPEAYAEESRVPKRVEFKSDAKVVSQLPNEMVKVFHDNAQPIYLSGWMELMGQKAPFVLTSFHGNPHLVFWESREGNLFANPESFNLALAPAADRKDDLLLIGGDHNNQPFIAMKRTAKP